MKNVAKGSFPDFNEILDTAQSRLADLRLEMPVNFRFSWREIPFTARIDEFGGSPRLRLMCDLGPVPYTAEDMSQRTALMGLIQSGDLGDGARYVMGGERRVNLIGDAAAPEELNGMTIIATVTAFLLKLRPYIDLARDPRALV
jgi:hypothetical protein